MEPTAARALLSRHWAAANSGDADAEHDLYAEDVIVDYPQSGEIIHGKADLRAVRTHQPGDRTLTIRKVVGSGDVWVSEYVLTRDGTPTYTVSIMQFSGAHVVRETQYFAEPFEPPEWRSQWVESASAE